MRNVLALLILSAMTANAQKPSVPTRVKQLHALLDEHWEWTLSSSPEFASILGDKRWNDRWSDYSATAARAAIAKQKSFLARFQAIDTMGFPEQEALNVQLMVANLEENISAERFHEWEMPVNQMNGTHIDLPQYVSYFSFETVKDYDDYIARLRKLPRVFRQVSANIRAGVEEGLLPPKLVLDQVVKQSEALATQTPDSSVFATPLAKIPDKFPAATKQRIRRQVLAAIKDSVLPAYVRFTEMVRTEYAPRGRTDVGIWSIPLGRERYLAAVKKYTSTDMQPDAIHELGLREVARIEAEQLAIAKKLGFSDLKSFRDSIPKIPALHPASRQAIIDEYQQYTDQMYAKLPELFGRLPKAKLVIKQIEPYREKESSTSYGQGTPDGSRPGQIWVNTYEYAKQLTINNESTAYHEGVPGHHMQVSIAQELPALPPFRQQASYNAYQEGWALYSERLGKEVGFYQDPYKDYGRLDDEMLRAIRLVVDTGIHWKHWTREQVIDYFHAHSSQAESLDQSETDRYIAWPGQALGYKVGQLTILRLRDEAKAALGPKFDIRAFHDEVLGAGALPMNVLEQRIRTWIASSR
jgi:uncharacterized protein (DUF885 family)